MGKARHNKTSMAKNNKISYSWLLSFIFLVSFIIAMPFLRGLMNGLSVDFSKNLNISFLLTAITIFFFTIYQLKHKHATGEHSYVQHVIWLIPLSSLISQLNAASAYYAGLSTLIATQAAIFFIISFSMNRDAKQQHILFWSVFSAAVVFIVYGLMNWFNSATLFGLLPKYTDAVWNSGTGMRLSSVFQYANTYAAFLICFGLISLFGAILSKQLKQRIVFSFMLVPILVSLLLTASRWGWLSFPVIFVLCLAFVSIRKQWYTLILLAFSAIVTLTILNPITNWGIQLQEVFSYSLAFKAWALLIGGSALVTAFHIGLMTLLEKKNMLESTGQVKLVRQFIIPIISIVLGIIGAILLFGTTILTRILPENLAERVASINLNQHSVLERFTFYRDALEIFKAYPIFGAGGGGWSELFQMYQNNPYISFEVHSYFIQLLVERGLFGLLIALAIFIMIYVLFLVSTFKHKKFSFMSFSWFIIATTILINSALDFHMSYVYINVLLFIALGGMLAATESNWLTKVNNHINKLKGNTTRTIGFVYIIISIVFGVIVTSNLYGYSKYNEAISTLNKIPFIDSYNLVDKAIKNEPHPNVIDLKLELLFAGYRAYNDNELLELASSTIQKYEKKEEYNERLLLNKLKLYEMQNNQELVISELNKATQRYVWDITYYEKLATVYVSRLTQATVDGQLALAAETFDQLIQLADTVNEKNSYLNTLPEEQLQGRIFEITKPIAGALGQANFIFGQYEQANQYLSSAYDSTYSYDSAGDVAIYYAALLGKSGKDYSSILEELNLLYEIEDNSIELQIKDLIQSKPFTP